MTSPMDRDCEITVLYFAAASTATGVHSETIKLPVNIEEEGTEGFPLSKLAPLLRSRYAETRLGEILEMSKWSVDLDMVIDVNAVILRGGEEVRSVRRGP